MRKRIEQICTDMISFFLSLFNVRSLTNIGLIIKASGSSVKAEVYVIANLPKLSVN